MGCNMTERIFFLYNTSGLLDLEVPLTRVTSMSLFCLFSSTSLFLLNFVNLINIRREFLEVSFRLSIRYRDDLKRTPHTPSSPSPRYF